MGSVLAGKGVARLVGSNGVGTGWKSGRDCVYCRCRCALSILVGTVVHVTTGQVIVDDR
jgi:hypothetical protein